MVLAFFAYVFHVVSLLVQHGILYCNCLVTCPSPQIDCREQKPNNTEWFFWDHIIRRESQYRNQASLLMVHCAVPPISSSASVLKRVFSEGALRWQRTRAQKADIVLSAQSLTSWALVSLVWTRPGSPEGCEGLTLKVQDSTWDDH